ncbi:MAG: hypothetical protein IJ375_06830 [Oscillospiraceae bacterium]|nr:hypothetical protein [Oscillospiraceae bacterium]
MNRLFWGLFFMTLDFHLNLGSVRLGLLPDFVGYCLLMKGMEELAEESKYFNRGRHWAFGLTLLHGILYGADLLDLDSGSTVLLWFAALAGFGAGMYLLYQMIAGIRQMEENHRWDLQGEKLKTMWMIETVMGVISHLLSWMPLVSAFAALAGTVTAICLLAAMYGTRKRYREVIDE